MAPSWRGAAAESGALAPVESVPAAAPPDSLPEEKTNYTVRRHSGSL